LNANSAKDSTKTSVEKDPKIVQFKTNFRGEIGKRRVKMSDPENMTAEAIKKQRAAYAQCLKTKIMNLNALTATSEASELDDALASVRLEMRCVEESHNK
jgi:hypothetical protein